MSVVPPPGRVRAAEERYHELGAGIVGIQEAWGTASLARVGAHWLHRTSTADGTGSYGVQLWAHHRSQSEATPGPRHRRDLYVTPGTPGSFRPHSESCADMRRMELAMLMSSASPGALWQAPPTTCLHGTQASSCYALLAAPTAAPSCPLSLAQAVTTSTMRTARAWRRWRQRSASQRLARTL